MTEERKHIIISLLNNIRNKDDQRSFEELFRLLYPGLLNFCAQYINDRERAEEIVSDVFTKLWLNRKDTHHIKNPETYLFISVRNHSINYLKQFSGFKLTFVEDTGEFQLINTHNPGKELERKELIFKMNQAIESLPKQCKIVFNLIREEGLKYKEVAEILNISPRTVETQLMRAMKKLNKIIMAYVDPESLQEKVPAGTKNSFKVVTLLIILFLM